MKNTIRDIIFISVKFYYMNILITIITLGLAITGLALGVIISNKPIVGSCGGLNPEGICSTCGGEPKNCENSKEQ